MSVPQKKSFRISGLAVLVVAFVGMGLLLFFDNTRPNTNPLNLPIPPTRSPDVDLYPNVSPSDIIAFRLIDPNSRATLTVERLDNDWVALEYPNEYFDSESLGAILQTIANFPFQRVFNPADGESLEQYGFYTDGRYVFGVQFITADDQQHIIAVGNPVTDLNTPNPNQAFYALVDDLAGIYIVPAGAVFFLTGQLNNPPFS
jgi:hypothetical protein